MSRDTRPAAYAVVIPAFNAARTLHDAISSALDQTVPAAAIIVVDDGSTDETADIAAGFGAAVRLVRQDNLGPAAATDRGIACVEVPLFAGLDADDVWFPEKAEKQLARLAADPKLDAVFCRAVAFAHSTSPDLTGPSRDMWSRSAMMMRRDAAANIGPVLDPTNLRGLGEMIRWLDRGRRQSLTFEMMPDVLFGRRIIEGSLSSARNPARFLPMIRAKLADRS